jgi:hypothetical protein
MARVKEVRRSLGSAQVLWEGATVVSVDMLLDSSRSKRLSDYRDGEVLPGF